MMRSLKVRIQLHPAAEDDGGSDSDDGLWDSKICSEFIHAEGRLRIAATMPFDRAILGRSGLKILLLAPDSVAFDGLRGVAMVDRLGTSLARDANDALLRLHGP